MPDSYVNRLRLEGGALAGAGALSSAALLALLPQSRRWPVSTVGQVALVAGVLAVRGPASVEKWMAAAERVDTAALTGEPTPLWHVPAPMVLGALGVKAAEALGEPLGARAGWDAALRVTAGSAVVGAVQALLLARRVASAEQREGRTYFRLPGSRLGKGTRLGYAVG